jgi:hypothetical protein
MAEKDLDNINWQIAQRCKERGDCMTSWKWRYESPSPEPEDLTRLNTDGMEYTPSEVDALEAIPPPTPPRQRSPVDGVHYPVN